MRAMGSADLHLHSTHGDGMATVAEVLEFVERERPALDLIAVTEHDTLRASDQARDLHARGSFRFDVVPGMEVTTLDGHLLALFVDEPLTPFRRIEETLVAIHRLGGLAVVPHPLSWLTRSVSARVLARVAAAGNDGVYFDGIEEYNSSPAGRLTSSRAHRLNQSTYGLAALGCSDAHFPQSIGSAYTTFAGASAAELRAAIAAGTTQAHASTPPSMRELGYANVMRQSWRGIMATPRNAGWRRTISSFIRSHASARAAPPEGERR